MMEKPVRSSFQYLSISYEYALAIGNSLSLPEMLHEVIHRVVHKTNAHRGIIWVKNGEQELQPVASAGINMEDILAQNEIKDLQNVLDQIQKSRQFVLRTKDDKDFLQYCSVLTGKEKSVLIVPVTNVAILYLIYAGREIADEPLANLLASLSKKLSIAIEACMDHENVIKEIQVRKKAEKELKKKTEQLVTSQKELQGLYGESEQARKSLLSILEDVMQKEEALKESESKLNSILSSIDDLVFVFDPEDRFIIPQDSPKEQLYTTPDEFIGKKPSEVMPSHLNKIFIDAFNKIRKGDVAEYDYWLKIEGKTLWFSAKHSPRFIDGEFMGSVAVVRDITERKQAEEAIQRSEEKYRLIFETAANLITSVNSEGIIIDCNNQIKSFLGYEKEEIIGNSMGKIIHQDSMEKATKFLKEILKTGFSYDKEYKMVRKGGEIIDVIINSSGINKINGAYERTICIINDITERKQAEEKIQHLNLVLRTIRNVNQLIVGEKNRDVLIQKVCEILIEDRGYSNAWLVLLGKQQEYINSAEAGLGKNFIPMRKMLKKGRLTNCGYEALRKKDLVIIKDPKKECKDCPLSANYSGKSSYTICIRHNDNIYGLLSVSASKNYIIDKEEQGLFKEVAGDIAFALYTIEMEEERKHVERVLEQAHNNTKTILEKAPVGVVVVGKDRKIKWVNESARKMAGVENVEVMIGKSCGEYLCPAEQKECSILDKGQKIDNSERILRRYDGKEIPIMKTVNEINFNNENVLLETFIDITERKKAEEAIQKSEEKYHLLADNSIDMIWQLDLKLVFTYVSPSVKKIMGYTAEEWIGSRLSQYATTKEFYNMAKKALYAVKHYKKFKQLTFHAVMLRKDGSEIPVEISSKLLFNKKGLPVGLQGITRDITERKKAEKQIQKDLKEKEIMLKEIHHRVKNNLQIMSSLLSLQSSKVDDERISGILNESRSRIRSMSIVHEMMYQNQDFAQINMKYYINRLIASLTRLYYQKAERIKILDKCKNVQLDLNRAIPCGMIMNELISNAMKHAFPDGRKGEIEIRLEKISNKFHLSVRDDGIALPPGFKSSDTDTLGMTIISDLTDQLDGKLKVVQGDGFKVFEVVFESKNEG